MFNVDIYKSKAVLSLGNLPFRVSLEEQPKGWVPNLRLRRVFQRFILIIVAFLFSICSDFVVFARDGEIPEEAIIKSIEDAIIEAEKVAEQETKRLKALELEKKKTVEANLRDTFNQGLLYYKDRNYPFAIMEFKKIIEHSPDSNFAKQAKFYLERSKLFIKRKEEQDLLSRMEETSRSKIKQEQEARQKKIEELNKKLEEDKRFEELARRQRIKEEREKTLRMHELFKVVELDLINKQIEMAIEKLEVALQEFPQEERIRDLIQKLKITAVEQKEKALKRERELNEEMMLLEVARRQIVPEEKFGTLETDKILPIVKVPEIRKKMKVPVSLDFKEVDLSYALGFLQDETGVNIVPSSEVNLDEKLTIKINDMPLEEALKYILKSQGLTYRIEEDAVWIATIAELDKEEIETRVYFLNKGVGMFSEGGSMGVSKIGEEKTTTQTQSQSSEIKTIKDILEKTVSWPKDSKIVLDDRTGALIISNTPSNLKLIDDLLYNLDVTPVQVLIEARFIELNVTDLDELGVEWKTKSTWPVHRDPTKQAKHGFSSSSGVDFADFSRKDEGFNLTYEGVLTHPQFQAVLHALQEKTDAKTLSAPRITTLNNQAATIEVVDEFIYPTRYEVSLVQYDINGDGDFDDAGESEWANIPQDFVTRDVGILLHVKPSVGIDKKGITLALTPEVSEYAGSDYTYSGNVKIPKFTSRNLSTSVVIENGETVVLGGLIKETNTKRRTKVPILGDIPILGFLFRKDSEGVERKNLLIFVTASVLSPSGEVVVER